MKDRSFPPKVSMTKNDSNIDDGEMMSERSKKVSGFYESLEW